MAETSISLDERVRKLTGDEHSDVLRETLAWFVRELMEAEFTQQIGAGLHEKAPGSARGERSRVVHKGAPPAARALSLTLHLVCDCLHPP
jgi:transposase-like protein